MAEVLSRLAAEPEHLADRTERLALLRAEMEAELLGVESRIRELADQLQRARDLPRRLEVLVSRGRK